MDEMKRSVMAAAAAAAGVFGTFATASASAKIVELGATATPLVAPKCPTGVSAVKCTIILTQVTALQTIRDGITYPTTVRQSGRIVAFTVGLSRLSTSRTQTKQFIHALDNAWGGVPQVSVTVLRPVGSSSKRRWKVVSTSSPATHLIPYLGQVVQFPLDTALKVQRGDVVALSTPTWAPVLSFDLAGGKFAYRQSRATGCGNPSVGQAQLIPGSTATYGCNYPGARVEYSVTEVTNPATTPNFVHAPIRRG
jgi:hypothetical protein